MVDKLYKNMDKNDGGADEQNAMMEQLKAMN